jgi:hypothetical protein
MAGCFRPFPFSGLAGGVSNVTRFPRPDADQFPTRSRAFLLRCRASLVRLRDSGVLTHAEFAAMKAKLIHGQAQTLTRGARSSVPAVVYFCDSRDHPETAASVYLRTGRGRPPCEPGRSPPTTRIHGRGPDA